MGHGNCPGRIVSKAISGLVCGLVGSAIYVGGTGVMRGLKTEQTIASMRAVPLMGAQVGVAVAVYATIDCLLKGVRGTDDRLNVIASGAATGALIAQPSLAYRSPASYITRQALPSKLTQQTWTLRPAAGPVPAVPATAGHRVVMCRFGAQSVPAIAGHF